MVDAEPVTITPLADMDQADWRRLWGAYQRFYGVDLSEAVHVASWARLLDPAEPMAGAIARDGSGTAVGLVHLIRHRTCWDIADSCYLQDLYVDEQRRGAGVGRALIAYAQDMAAAFGAAHVHWLTHESNSRARRLYDDVATRSGFIDYRVPALKQDPR